MACCKSISIIVADLPCTFHAPGGEGCIRSLAEALENRGIAVPGDGDSVRFVGFEVQFDATAGERFFEGMASIGRFDHDVPLAILFARRIFGLTSEEIIAFLYTGPLALAERDGLRAKDPVVRLCHNRDGARLRSAAISCSGSGYTNCEKCAEEHYECENTRKKLFCRLSLPPESIFYVLCVHTAVCGAQSLLAFLPPFQEK